MTDVAVAPVDPPVGQTFYGAIPVQQADPPPEITPEMQARADALYAELKPAAAQSYVGYIIAHTPVELQPAMKLLVEADTPGAPPPVDPAVASVANGSSVAVTDLAGSPLVGSPGTAEVANSALAAVHLTV